MNDRKEKKRQYNAANKERIAAQKRQYKLANKERISQRDRQYRKDHKDRITLVKRRWRQANPGWKIRYVNETNRLLVHYMHSLSVMGPVVDRRQLTPLEELIEREESEDAA